MSKAHTQFKEQALKEGLSLTYISESHSRDDSWLPWGPLAEKKTSHWTETLLVPENHEPNLSWEGSEKAPNQSEQSELMA